MFNKQINLQKVKIASITFVTLILYYLLLMSTKNISTIGLEKLVFVLSWVGIFELIYIIQTWRNLTGKYISLYTLFMVFFFLFNFGQPFLWAFNIHNEREIGSMNLYYTLSVPENFDIVQTQLIVLISGIMIHFGATFFKKSVTNKNRLDLYNLISNISSEQKNLYKFSLFISPVVIFSEYYNLLINLRNAQIYGYTDLYYNPEVGAANVIIQIISRLFFPVLMGLLIGSGYNRKVIKIVYFLFLIDVVISLFIGDRGGWIYALCVLIICHHYFYQKIRLKQSLIIILLGIVISYLSVAIVNIRNHGVSIEGLVQTISDIEQNPLILVISQMGGSMGITTALVMEGWDIFPYGNTFFYGLLIAPTKDIIDWFNLNYESLGGWFSQEYLKISNGAGFSIVAETLLNYGPFLLPISMWFFGVFVFLITDIENINPNNNTKKLMFCIMTTVVTINISRNVFSYNAGEILYTTIQYFIYYNLFKILFTPRNTTVALAKKIIR